MSAHENEIIVRRFWDSMSRGDIDQATALWSTNAQNHGKTVGREGVRAVFTDLREALDERYEIHDLIATEDTVVCRLTASGTHRSIPKLPIIHGGFLMGVPPRGNRYAIQQIHILRCQEGAIVAHWANRDDLGMMQQLGLDRAA